MTSPFDPDYEVGLDVAPIKKAAKISATSSKRRARDLKSDDPEVVKRATGCMGDLTSRGLSPEYVKGRLKGRG